MNFTGKVTLITGAGSRQAKGSNPFLEVIARCQSNWTYSANRTCPGNNAVTVQVKILSQLSLFLTVDSEGFVLCEWRHAIDQRFEGVFAGVVYAPHRNMHGEFELDFRGHPWHRLIEYVALAF